VKTARAQAPGVTGREAARYIHADATVPGYNIQTIRAQRVVSGKQYSIILTNPTFLYFLVVSTFVRADTIRAYITRGFTPALTRGGFGRL